MNTKPARILYLPMEIASRELDARLLLSAIAIERGFDVVLGQKWLMERNVDRMTPGVYLSKTLTVRDAKVLSRARHAGYITAAIDEEIPGLVVQDRKFWWMAPEAVRDTDLIFIPGTFNSSAMRESLGLSEHQVRKAANPRWDLLRPELRSVFAAEADALRARYGEFILVNSNLGLTNSHKGTAAEMIQGLIDQGKIPASDLALIEDLKAIVRMEAANRETLVDLLPKLAHRFPAFRLVLRPHPSEQIDSWKAWLAHCPGVEIVREGSAIPWILAARVLLHTNCTTGVEAIALDKPAICLIQAGSPANGRYLANRVNPVVTDAAGAIAVLERCLATPASCYSDAMRQFFADSMTVDSEHLGAQQIIDALEECGATRGWAAHTSAASAWRPYRGYRWKQADKNVRGALFPGLDLAALSQRLAQLQGLLGLERRVAIEACGAKTVLLTTRRLSPSTRIRRSLGALLPA